MLMHSNKIIALVLAVVILSGCGATRRKAGPVLKIDLVEQHASASKPSVREQSDMDTLSLAETISLALDKNKELQVFKTEILASQAHTTQQSLLPNPDLGIELENFAGNGLMSGLSNTETTISIGQLIELGGKRSKRTEIASIQSELAMLRYERKRLEIISNVRRNFTNVLSGIKKVNLNRRLWALAQSFKATVDTMVKAGRLSKAESARAQVELSNRKINTFQSFKTLRNAKRNLALTWAGNSDKYSIITDEIPHLKAVPKSENVLAVLSYSPIILEQNVEIKFRKAESTLARALAIPDPEVSLGYRRFNETENQAFVAGLNLPLPFFNRNQGGRQEALLRVRQSEQQLQSLQVTLATGIKNRLATIRTLSEEIRILQKSILPEAEKAYTIIHMNYGLGKFGILDVLDAQRQLFETENRLIETQSELNLEIIEVEGLLGRSLNTL